MTKRGRSKRTDRNDVYIYINNLRIFAGIWLLYKTEKSVVIQYHVNYPTVQLSIVNQNFTLLNHITSHYIELYSYIYTIIKEK